MLTGTTIFTGLIQTSDVTSLIVQFGYVFAGLIVVTIALAPLFLAKGGFRAILSKVQSLIGGK